MGYVLNGLTYLCKFNFKFTLNPKITTVIQFSLEMKSGFSTLKSPSPGSFVIKIQQDR